ncbi:MAG: hypothetical protein AB2L14_17925 [Candidatus Xenobiia bacterium LiM19]
MADNNSKDQSVDYSWQPHTYYEPPEEEAEAESSPGAGEDAGIQDKNGSPAVIEEPNENGISSAASLETNWFDEMIDLGHTTAFSQFLDILEAFQEGKLNKDETYYFLEELYLYLNTHSQKFNAIEELAPEDENQRQLLLQGLKGLQNCLSEFKSYFEYGDNESPQRLLVKLQEEARESDTLILQAITTLRNS